MDKVIIINKEKGYTSRDIVNIVSKKLNTKKVGHFGTLDPLATGVLVLGIGCLTKLDDFDIFDTKEYVADVLIGTKTDTYDVDGNVFDRKDVIVNRDDIEKVLESFNKTYMQEVPIYSAVKVNGKKLYEYARNNEKVQLPKKEVTISNMKLISMYSKNNNNYFQFSCTVSKGTYIRSLINDMSYELGVYLCMSDLKRVRQGNFLLEDANCLADIESGNIKFLDITDVLLVKKMVIPNYLYKKIMSGNLFDDFLEDYILFTDDDGGYIVLYKRVDEVMRPCFFFKN